MNDERYIDIEECYRAKLEKYIEEFYREEEDLQQDFLSKEDMVL